jgi:hypothetical protein
MGTLSCHGPELTILGGSAAWPEIEFEKNEGGGVLSGMDGELGQVGSWGGFRMESTLGKRRGGKKHKGKNGESMGRGKNKADPNKIIKN